VVERGRANGACDRNGHSVADLHIVSAKAGACEDELVGKALQTGGFAHRNGALLRWMDVRTPNEDHTS
jgi:hypothetical protein